jgi:hypothetical protein
VVFRGDKTSRLPQNGYGFADLREMWEAELHRVEEVLEAKLKRLEER